MPGIRIISVLARKRGEVTGLCNLIKIIDKQRKMGLTFCEWFDILSKLSARTGGAKRETQVFEKNLKKALDKNK